MKLTFLKKFLISLAGKKHYQNFTKSCENVEKAQRDLLQEIIENCAETTFGKDHNFATISSAEEYQKAVPIRDFEAHRPYIDKMIAGESDVLFPGRPLSYSMTSGTTAKHKYIPISESYQKCFTRLNRIWFYSCILQNPELFDGYTLAPVSPAVEGYLDDGSSFGSLSGKSYLNVPGIIKTTFSTPYDILTIEDYSLKYYGIMRGALGRDITYIVCASPSNLFKLHQTVIENFEDMVRDIRNGTLREDVLQAIPEEKREEVLAYYKPNPERANELMRLYKKYRKELIPAHYFPNVKLVNTWKQGNFRRLMPKIKRLFAKSTNIRAMGYQASEARAGIVLKNEWNYSLLAHDAYYYEFIAEEHRDMENPPIKMLHQLREGERYYILITNNSGLYRYDINDLVQVCGFYKSSPQFYFIQKGAGITNITGEKLSEQQVISAAEHAATILEMQVPFYTMYCDYESGTYTKYVEFDGHCKESKKLAFMEAVDGHLAIINPEYKVKRGTQRLEFPLLKELQPASHEAFKQILIEKKLAKDGQFKDLYLQSMGHIKDILDTLVV